MLFFFGKTLTDLFYKVSAVLLQDAPANTTSYMIAGYTVIFGVMALYLVSVMVRFRNLKQELEILQDLS